MPIETGLSDVRARFVQPLTVLMVMVALLLVIGCANVATMLLSRASARKTEIVIRTAIGAGHGRLLRQLATESVLLVAAAAALGVVFAWSTLGLLLSLMQAVQPSLVLDLAIDRRVLLFTVIVSAAAAVIAGLTPGVPRRQVQCRERVEGSTRERRGRTCRTPRTVRSWSPRSRSRLSLVAAAGLLARTLHSLTTVDAGFATDRVVLATVNPGSRGYKDIALAHVLRGAARAPPRRAGRRDASR